MANYSTLKAAVADVVKTNGSQAITGANLQSVLLSIINSIGGGGYIFAGVATPETSVGTPDQNVFYITGAGTFANMGTSTTVPQGSIGIFKYNGSWSNSTVKVYDGADLGFYDISANNSGASYATLSAALAAVPSAYQKGGMTIKYKDEVTGKYVQYRLKSAAWNTTESNWQGIDQYPTGGSGSLVESGGTIACINNYQNASPALDRQSRLMNLRLIDNAYVGSDGELHKISAASTYHYMALYKFSISDFQRIELHDLRATGNSRLILYNAEMTEVYNDNASGSPYIIDNSGGSYHYMSFGSNVITSNVRMTVTPRVLGELAQYPYNGVRDIIVPDDLVSEYLIVNNQLSSNHPSGYSSVYGLYIGRYRNLLFIPYNSAFQTSYKYIWLTDGNGDVTSVSWPDSGALAIDNANSQYKYISWNRADSENNGHMLASYSDIAGMTEYIMKEVDGVKDDTAVYNIRTSNILKDKDVIEDAYINSKGILNSYTETSTTKFCAVYFYPVSTYDYFMASGSVTGSSSYVKTYNQNLEEIGTYQGYYVTLDNSDREIAYVSFSSNVKVSQLVLYVSQPAAVNDCMNLSREMLIDAQPDWIANAYINASNGCKYTGEGESYKYYAVPDYYVQDASTIILGVALGGSARVVTTNANHEVIDVYTSGELTINNSNGNIAYISVTNNAKAMPNPVFKLLRVPVMNEAVDVLIGSQNNAYLPLANKNIAVLGDSIMMIMSPDQSAFGGNVVTYRDANDNIYELNELTNIGGLLYVTSSLDGGEVVSDSIRVDIHNSNQSRMDAATWPTLRDALHANYIINTGKGGATIMGNTITTSYPAYNESTFNTMPNHCLELKRRVDAGEPVPDVIMMWAGTNGVYKFIVDGQWVEPTNFDEIMALDYETQLLADTDAAMEYKKTIYGALRFCLEFLYRNFPKANVVLFSPIPSVVPMRNYERLRKIGGYIKNMAERYSALFVDACVEMGITDILDTETNHVWLSDGLHPNAAGKVLYCNYTAKKLNTIAFLKD